MDACIGSFRFARGPRRRVNRSLGCHLLLAGLLALMMNGRAAAADLRTTNFLVMAPTPELARAVGDAAEGFRRDLALYWLGEELPPWPNPCPIRVIAGPHLAAQGVTTYNRSPVRDFQMEVVGSPQRILDSVLPHEVTHTILATYFGRPLPRWADEGICTTVEHPSERAKHEEKLREFLRTRRGIAMNKLFLMTEYPSDVLPMYAQGYSVCQFLIAQRGPRALVAFLGDYMQKPSWTHHVRSHYGYESLAELQEAWLAWVANGSGPVDAYVKQLPASSTATPITLASASGPTAAGPAPDPASLAANVSPASATTPAGGDGWYSRLRREAIGAGAKPPSGQLARGNRPQAPPRSNPSLHSVSQPQPEQGPAPGGSWGGSATVPYRRAAESGGYRPGSVASGGTYLR